MLSKNRYDGWRDELVRKVVVYVGFLGFILKLSLVVEFVIFVFRRLK